MSSQLVTDVPPRREVGVAVPERRAAVIAGLAYVLIIVLAVYANFFVLDRLVKPDDAAATVRNIADSATLFRSGIAAFVLVFIADAVVAWALYVFLRRASRELSLFAAWFRLVYVAIAGAALLHLLVAARLVEGAGYAAALAPGQREAQVMSSLDAYIYGWRIALAAFGVHLMLVGHVLVKSGYAPRILGRLVTLAGLGYLVSVLIGILLPTSESRDDLILGLLALVAVPGEFGLTGWLLWHGGKDAVSAAR